MNSDNRRLSRRYFLKQMSLGVGAIGAGMMFPGEIITAIKPVTEKSQNPQNVLVLGSRCP